MDKWTEFRTAYKLAEYRTLSATADVLGIHRTTVMRHIDALESILGIVLFQRNDKGYIPTEAGLEVMKLGAVTEQQFTQLIMRLSHADKALSGKLSVTSIDELAYLIMPFIKRYQEKYPKMKVDFIGDIRNFNLEYGEADIAIRIGEKPTTLDNVVIPLLTIDMALCVHRRYLIDNDVPTTACLNEHPFIAMKSRPVHLSWNEWIHENIPNEQIVLYCANLKVCEQALSSGIGIAAMPKSLISSNDELIQICPTLTWSIPSWLLVHRDMVHLNKIKAFIDIVKAGVNV